jgi:hypothetical protein
MDLWRRILRMIRRDSDDDSHGKWSDARDQMLDARVAALEPGASRLPAEA